MGAVFSRAARSLAGFESGYTFIELLIAMSIFLVITSATFAALEFVTKVQTRDQAYADEITTTQAALARLVHDVREATSFQLITPNAVEFQFAEGGTTYNVEYNCDASDSLGSAYTRCARTQAVAPTAPPAASSTVGALDIQHVENGAISTFCNAAGSAQSGAVFYATNPSIPNTDGSGLACDENYENEIARQLLLPSYLAIRVVVPASGDLASNGLTHQTVLQTGVYLPNSDAGS